MNRRSWMAAFATVLLAGCASLGLGGFKEPLVHFNRAIAFEDQQRYGESVASYQRCLELAPAHVAEGRAPGERGAWRAHLAGRGGDQHDPGTAVGQSPDGGAREDRLVVGVGVHDDDGPAVEAVG